jgi:hypothetical protein
MALVPPVQKDGFSYAGDSFYREASNLNRHRRATLPELKNHFNGKDTENRPAHWYEAQLLHYGLPPSKVKGTAHKRLFDAVMGSGLAVPSHIQKIETDLKKEWAKKEREAKKMLKESATTKPPAKGTKRKADQVSTSTSVNVSVSVSSTGVVEVQAAAKKAKVTPKTTAKEKKAAPAAKPIAPTAAPKEKKKQTARKSTAPSTTVEVAKTTTVKPKAAAAAPKEKKTTAPKTTAEEKKPAPAKSTTAAAKPAKPTANPKPKGAASKASQQLAPSQGHDHADAPPPYSEYDPGVGSGWMESVPPISPTSPRRRIGLLNGRYSVSCDHVELNFPEYQDRLNLIATLDGNALWLNFNLGVATGMMRVQRPYEVNTEDAITVFWRGNALPRMTNQRELFNIDTDGRAGSSNGLFFMGDGHLRGFIRYGSERDDNEVDLEFDAYRQPNQSMTSEISPTEAREIWASLQERQGSYYSDSDSYDDY